MPESTALCSWSYHNALPPKNSNCLFLILCMRAGSNVPATGCACAFFISVVLVVWQPDGVRVLNQLISRSLRFSSHSYASLLGETTSVFSCFKSPCQSKMLKASSRVINLFFFLTYIELFWEEYMYFSVAHDRMYDVEWRVNWKHHINKWKAIGSTLNISHFMGC